MNESLLQRLRPVASRLRRVRFWQLFAISALLAALIGWALLRQAASGELDGRSAALALIAAVAGVAFLVAIACWLSFRDPRKIARQIEAKFPTLDQRLL